MTDLQKTLDFFLAKAGYIKTKNSVIAEKLQVDEDVVSQAKKQLQQSTKVLNQENIKEAWIKSKDASIRYVAKPTQTNNVQEFQNNFKDFLNTYKPSIKSPSNQLLIHEGCLIVDIQDPHYNKLDENGSNNLEQRFDKIYKSLQTILENCSKLNILDKIVYVIADNLIEMNHYTWGVYLGVHSVSNSVRGNNLS